MFFSPFTQHSAFAILSLEHNQLLQTQPQRAQHFCRTLPPTTQTLRNPQSRTPKHLRKLKSPPFQQPQITVKMLSKSIVLALAWLALSGSIARATPVAKRAQSDVADDVPWYCRPSEYPVVFSYIWVDVSEGLFHLAKKTSHAPIRKLTQLHRLLTQWQLRPRLLDVPHQRFQQRIRHFRHGRFEKRYWPTVAKRRFSPVHECRHLEGELLQFIVARPARP